MSVLPPDGIQGTDALSGITPVTPAQPLVAAVTPADAATPVAETPDKPDAATISESGRARAMQAILEGGTGYSPSPNALDPSLTATTPALLELLRTFDNYDNSQAVERYRGYLTANRAYGNTPSRIRIDVADAEVRNAARAYVLAIATEEAASRRYRDGMTLAIDEWLAGGGVFIPQMIEYPSSDGFRFIPLTEGTATVPRPADVFATDERDRIALYLTEMALLTPASFIFYDPTGLGLFTLQYRRQFLAEMDDLLDRLRDRPQPVEGIDARASDLRYAFDSRGFLDFSQLREREREIEKKVQKAIDASGGILARILQSLRRIGLMATADAGA